MQSESELSAAFSEFGRLEPVQKPSKAMLEWKEKAFAPGSESEKLVEHVHSGVDVARKDIRTLRSRQWLNDEVMNVYMGLLQVGIDCFHGPCDSRVFTSLGLSVSSLYNASELEQPICPVAHALPRDWLR